MEQVGWETAGAESDAAALFGRACWDAKACAEKSVKGLRRCCISVSYNGIRGTTLHFSTSSPFKVPVLKPMVEWSLEKTKKKKRIKKEKQRESTDVNPVEVEQYQTKGFGFTSSKGT